MKKIYFIILAFVLVNTACTLEKREVPESFDKSFYQNQDSTSAPSDTTSNNGGGFGGNGGSGGSGGGGGTPPSAFLEIRTASIGDFDFERQSTSGQYVLENIQAGSNVYQLLLSGKKNQDEFGLGIVFQIPTSTTEIKINTEYEELSDIFYMANIGGNPTYMLQSPSNVLDFKVTFSDIKNQHVSGVIEIIAQTASNGLYQHEIKFSAIPFNNESLIKI